MKGILICAHGSTESETGSAVREHSARVSSLTGLPVYYGFNASEEPSITDALHKMSADGFDEVIVIPLFFAPGFLANKIVPKALGMEPETAEGEVTIEGHTIRIRITGVFGDHPGMKDVLRDVISSCGASAKDTAVILIGHGSKDGKNSATVRYNASFVSEMGYEVFCAYNEMQSPTVEEALKSALGTGCKQIIAIPMFVSPSVHSTEEIPAKLGIKEGRKTAVGNTEVIYCQEIGMHPKIADILAERAGSV